MTDQPRSKGIRRRLKLTQEQFAKRYKIPLEVVKDWEANRKEPDSAHNAYLTVISKEPVFVAEQVKEKKNV